MSSMSSDTSSMSMDMGSGTTMVQATTTTAAWNSYQTPSYQLPTYGSGSSNWGSSSNYNDCVSQCLAQYGGSPQPWTPPPTQTTSDSSSGGSGVTHTVIVAPSQGVLRYVPFAVNASIGDTVKFMWGADNHTVTKGSELTPCNATSDSPFASGIHIKDFVFEQVVNDTNPTFFHCAVPGHCQKGMFGIINPASNFGSGTSVSLMMSEWTSANPDLMAYSAITSNMTQDNAAASRWGGNIDVAGLPDWSQPLVAENVLYTRSFLASNPETMNTDGSIDLGKSSGTPLMIPQDISVALSNASMNTTAGGAPSAAAAPPSVAPSSSSAAPSTSGSAAANLTNGAATTSPKFVVAVAAAVAGFFLL
jgi:plastocyanin